MQTQNRPNFTGKPRSTFGPNQPQINSTRLAQIKTIQIADSCKQRNRKNRKIESNRRNGIFNFSSNLPFFLFGIFSFFPHRINGIRSSHYKILHRKVENLIMFIEQSVYLGGHDSCENQFQCNFTAKA